eukprot:jgi/Mesvir1/12139/Mv00392-RA.1
MAERRSGRARKPPPHLVEEYVLEGTELAGFMQDEPNFAAANSGIESLVAVDDDNESEPDGFDVFVAASAYSRLPVKPGGKEFIEEGPGFPWVPGYRAEDGAAGVAWTVVLGKGRRSISPGCSVEVSAADGTAVFAEITQIVPRDAAIAAGIDMSNTPGADDNLICKGFKYYPDEEVKEDAYGAFDWPENPLTLVVTAIPVVFPPSAVKKVIEVRPYDDMTLGQNVDYLVEYFYCPQDNMFKIIRQPTARELYDRLPVLSLVATGGGSQVACHIQLVQLKTGIVREMKHRFTSAEASQKATAAGTWLSIDVSPACFYALPDNIRAMFSPGRSGDAWILQAEWESPESCEALKALVAPTWYQLPLKGGDLLEFYGGIKMRFFPYRAPHIKLWLEHVVVTKNTGYIVYYTKSTPKIEEAVMAFRAAHARG